MSQRPIFKNSNEIMALERDYDALNLLYVLDKQLNIYHLKREDGKECTVMKQQSLSQFNEDKLKPSIDWLQDSDFARVSFQQRCISINDQTFIYDNQNQYESLLPEKCYYREKKVLSYHRLEFSDLDILTIVDQSDRNKVNHTISWVVKIPPGSRQLNTIGHKHLKLARLQAFVSSQTILVLFQGKQHGDWKGA